MSVRNLLGNGLKGGQTKIKPLHRRQSSHRSNHKRITRNLKLFPRLRLGEMILRELNAIINGGHFIPSNPLLDQMITNTLANTNHMISKNIAQFAAHPMHCRNARNTGQPSGKSAIHRRSREVSMNNISFLSPKMLSHFQNRQRINLDSNSNISCSPSQMPQLLSKRTPLKSHEGNIMPRTPLGIRQSEHAVNSAVDQLPGTRDMNNPQPFAINFRLNAHFLVTCHNGKPSTAYTQKRAVKYRSEPQFDSNKIDSCPEYSVPSG